MGTHSSSRRRGASLAACAFGLTLALSGVQPIAAQHTLPVAHAAPRTTVHWDTLRPAFGESATAPASVRALGLFGRPAEPTSWALSEGFEAPEGWSIELDDAGAITAQPPTPFTEGATDEFDVPVQVTFSDGTSSEFSAHVELADEPYLIAPGDKTYWSGRLILPLYLRAVNVPLGSKLELDGLPDGLWTTIQAPGLKRSQYFYVNGRPEGTGEYPVTLRVVDRHGEPVENAAGPLETEFTITFRDPTDLEPIETELADSPAEPVAAGEPIRIPISADNAASVEVSGLPDGVEFNGEDSAIEGTPEEPGTSSVTVDLITDDGERLVDTFDLVVEGETSAESSAQAESSATSAPESAEPSAKNSAQAEESAESSATTTGVTTAESSAQTETSAPESAEPTAKTSAQAEEFEEPSVTTAGETSAESSAQAETSTLESAEPTAKNSAQAETSALESAEPTTKNSAQAEKPTAPVDPAGPEEIDQFEWDEFTVAAGAENAVDPVRSERSAVVTAEAGAPDWVTVFRGGQVYASPSRDVAPGEYPVRVRTSNGETDTIHVRVVEAANDAERYTPTYAVAYARAGGSVQSLPPRATFTVRSSEFDNQPLPEGTRFEVDGDGVSVDRHGAITYAPPLDAQVGKAKLVPVKVVYPDGSSEGTVARFEVLKARDAELYTPAYQAERAAGAGETATVAQTARDLPAETEFSLDPAADLHGWDVRVDARTGRVEATAPETPADLDVNVHVSYADGSEETVPVHVAARRTASMAQATELRYDDAYAAADGTITIAPRGAVPEGVAFAAAGATPVQLDVEPSTGVITAKLPDDAPADTSYTLGVRAAFPDGSATQLSATVTTDSQARHADVRWPSVAVPVGADAVTAQVTGAPAGTTFALAAEYSGSPWPSSVDPTTGALTVAAPKGANAGDGAEVPVVVTFPDGSQRLVAVRATAVDAMAGAQPTEYGAAEVRPGDSVTVSPAFAAAQFSLVEKVEGLSTRIDATSGALTATATTHAAPGPRRVPVRVTFADSTQATAYATVTVLPADVTAQAQAQGEGASAVGKLVALALGILASAGAVGFGLYENREFFRTFLAFPLR